MVGTGLQTMTPEVRFERFWAAHGRTRDRLTTLHALSMNPTLAWSPELLCVWYGCRVDRARAILAEFARCGIARPVEDGTERYAWNAALGWAVPSTRADRGVLAERWATFDAA